MDEEDDEIARAPEAQAPAVPESPAAATAGAESAEPTTGAATDAEGVSPAEAVVSPEASLGADAEAVQPPAEAATPTDAGGDEDFAEEGPSLSPQDLRAILEALIFASPQPITKREIGKALGSVPKREWQAALDELVADYAREGRGLQLVEVAGGWQITTRPEYHDYVREILDPRTPTRLSIQALETLAVIAYKQPVTLPEVIDLRGVKSGGVIKTLLEKRLIKIIGRKEVVGRPILYGTTKQFLLLYGLKDLEELPRIEDFAEVLGEDVDVTGLKRALEAPRPIEVPLAEEAGSAPEGSDGPGGDPDGRAPETQS
jgi:segregation and condensation protein B